MKNGWYKIMRVNKIGLQGTFVFIENDTITETKEEFSVKTKKERIIVTPEVKKDLVELTFDGTGVA